MSRFVLTAQLQLQAPTNTRQVVNQIQRQLAGGVNVNVNVRVPPTAQRQLTNLNNQVNNLNRGGQTLSRTFGVALRRFAGFAIATRAIGIFTAKLSEGVSEAIKFEREVVKIAQVTGKSVQELNGLTKTITSLSTSLGVTSSELVGTSRILAQAGIKAGELDVALSALAKTTLAPTFEDINKTAEGAVAILAQFKQGVGALEDQLGSINRVAGQFAVESGDLISAVRRFGGVFKSAGGELDELLGLFTSVRATTRESAESIATGLRTIFTRIQRPKTIEFLRKFGVELTDLEGKFVGPFEAVRQLSNAFAGLEEGDIRFVQVAEELGGFRQIGKVIPLIQQFTVAEKARQAALEGRGSLDKDAITAQQALAVQLSKVKEEFLALVRGISETGTFQVLVKSTLALTSSLIALTDAFKPLLPILTAFATLRIASSIGGIARGIGAGFVGRNQGGPIPFARGGVVPGSGNRDTVPAMLTPGEFVIRKSSVKKLGAGRLAAMNENKYASGGPVKKEVEQISKTFPSLNKNLVPYKNIQPKDNVSGNIKVTKIGKIPPRTSQRVLKELLSKNTKVSADAFEEIAAKQLKGTLLKPDKSPIDIATARGLTEVKFKPLKNIKNTEILGKLFRDSIGAEAGSTKRRAAKLRNYKTPKGGENSDFGTVGLAIPENKQAIIKEARAKLKQREKKKFPLKLGKTGLGRYFGGAIQKFALGGVVASKKVGAAILDPDQQKPPEKVSVGITDVKPYITKSTQAQVNGLSSEFKNTDFTVSKQGLNKKTSDGFKKVLLDGAAKGVNDAVSNLGSDLGLGRVTAGPDSVKKLKERIESSGALGGPFENALNLLSNRGQFKPEPNNEPFDFPRGLSGPPADNFNKLPSSFVDAKSSYDAAKTSGIKIKIAREVAAEYKRSPAYKKLAANTGSGDKAGLLGALKARFPNKTGGYALSDFKTATGRPYKASEIKALGFNKVDGTRYLNKGGGTGPSSSDTVPAMLTPGEFVINKKAAQSIGAGNLNRMNKQGVAGFAKGGAVGGVQKFNRGGAAGGGGGGAIFGLALLPGIVQQLTGASDGAEKSLSDLERQGFDFGSVLQKTIGILSTVGIALSVFGIQLSKNTLKLAGTGKGGLASKLFGLSREEGADGKKRRVRAEGESFAERFSDPDGKKVGKAGRVRDRGETIAERNRKQKSLNLSKAEEAAARQARANDVKAAREERRRSGSSKRAKSGTGKLGTKFGNLSRQGGARGLIGRAGGLLGRAGAAAGAGSLGGLAASVAAFAGPIAAGAAAAGLLSAALKSGFNVQQKYNQAVKEGNVAKAKEFAAINKLSGIEQALSGIPGVGDSIVNFGNLIRGTSTEAEVKKAELAALAGKADKEKAKNAKAASEAMKDVEAGAISLQDAFASGQLTRNISNAFELNQKAQETNLENSRNKSGGGFGTRNILTLGGLIGESSSEKNIRIEEENRKRTEENTKRLDDAFSQLLPTIRKQARSSIAAGVSFDQFTNIITNNGKAFQLTENQAIQLEKEFINLKLAALDNRIAFLSLNLGLDPLIRAQQGLGVEFGNLADAASGSFDPVANAAKTLKAAVDGADITDGAFNSAIKTAEKTLGELGASESQITKAKNSITAFRIASDAAKDVVRDLGEDLPDTASPEEIKDKLLENLSNLKGLDKEQKEILKDSLAGLELTDADIEAIRSGGDISEIVNKIRETGGKSIEQLTQLFDEYGNAQKQLLRITQARIEKEAKLVSAISSQEDAAKTLAEFLGKTFSADQKSSFARRRFEVESGGAGSTPAELRADLAARRESTAIAAPTLDPVTGQPQQTAKEKQTQQENLRQDEAVAKFTKEKLAIIREEINVLKSRLKLEQDAAQALLGGDIGKFAENISGSIAASAFRSGDTQTLQSLGGEALSTGFASLTDEEKAASKGQLEALGISSGLADSAAGTSPEIEALKAEGVAYAEVLVEAADNTAKYAESQLNFAKQSEEQAQKTLEARQKELEKMKEANEQRQKEIDSLKEKAKQEKEATRQEREDLNQASGLDFSYNPNRTTGGGFNNPAAGFNEGFFSTYAYNADFNPFNQYNRGGTVYASRGMFIPRGTDTVPAMLTPGEFVVNRAAVQRGNNLQLLRAMNGGDTSSNGAPASNGPAAMSRGGSVGYYNQGGEVAGGMGDFINGMSQAISQLGGAFGTFSQSVQQLANMKLSVDLAPTRVDVNVIGPMLSELTEATKEVVLNAVVSEIQLNQLGQLERNV